MADNRWLDVDGNWTNTSNWSLGAAPVSTNNVYIYSGSQTINTNLDAAAVDLASLKIGGTFTGSIGGTGNPLKISATDVWVGGGNEVWLQGATSHQLTEVNIDKPGHIANGCVLSGYMVKVKIVRGDVQIAPNSNSDSAIAVYMLYRDHRESDAHLTVGASITNLTNIYQVGGVIKCGTAFTNLYKAGGSFTSSCGAVTLINQHGGTFYWTSDETLTAFNLYGGKLDATGLTAFATTPTITTLNFFPGAVADFRNGLGNLINGTNAPATLNNYSVSSEPYYDFAA